MGFNSGFKGLMPAAVVDELELKFHLAIVDEMELKFHLIHDSSRQQYWFDNT